MQADVTCIHFHVSSGCCIIHFITVSFHFKEIGFFSFASLGTYVCPGTNRRVIQFVAKTSRSVEATNHMKF